MSKTILSTRDDGTRVLRLFGEWTPEVESAVALDKWDMLSLFSVDWRTFEPLLPFRDKIKCLRVSGGPESSKGLDKLSGLEDLDLDDFPKPAVDFRKLPKLRKLKVLWDRSRKTCNLANPNLEYLQVDTFGDKDLSVFSELSKLVSLDIRQGSLQSLSGIENLHSLRSLYLIRLRNFIDISGLEACGGLEVLDCRFLPKLSDVEAVRMLARLKSLELDAENASLSDLKFLGSMPDLERLMLTVQAGDIDWHLIANHPSLKSIAITAHAEYGQSDGDIEEILNSGDSQPSKFQRLNGVIPGFVVEW